MKINKKLLFLIFLAIVLLPSLAYAQNTLLDIVTSVKGQLTALGSGLATIAFIIAGIMYLSATANPERMKIAKGALIAAVVGIVIIVLANGAEGFVKSIFFDAG